ncbi:MAG: VWA domain-containing protein [Spirochaetaceae bacterium]|jgi:Ca-activated chloride channel family protein|nr:VWA domain-containing protein [Spirochaetaceae bacterium]
MKFDHSGMFTFLLIIVPFIFLQIVHYVRKFPVVSRLIDPQNDQILSNRLRNGKTKKTYTPAQKRLRLRYVLSAFFFLLFYAFIICALAGPRWGSRTVQELKRGADIVFAFDISRSMEVRDTPVIPELENGISASRLERSVWIAKKFIASFNSTQSINIRLGIAIGKGTGVLAVPLTGDNEAIFSLLDSLSSLSMTSRGTNLEKLLDAASGAFQDSFPAARSVILFTDGEALSGSLNTALERLASKNITTIAVGCGSIYGAPLPESMENPAQYGKTKSIKSYLKADELNAALLRSGGIYIDGNYDEAPYILAEKIKPEAINSSWITREESVKKWYYFVLLALASLILSVLCTLRVKQNF